jgi:teichoic acid transport system ATP-binding protein
MAKTVIEFKNVSKIYKLYKNDKARFLSVFSKKVPYKEKRAVDDVSFKIEKGEAVAIFGKNGAGKSTVLKMITGVAYATKGEVYVDGRVSALLELTSGFDPEFTGRENIYLKGQLSGLLDEEIRELEQTIIDFSEVGEYIDQPVRTYSSGMKARLGFAVNVNINPEILIVDEALSVGDVAFKNKCLAKVNEIISKDNVTLLFVTHATGTAKEFCTRGIVMKNGKMIYDDDIDSAIQVYNDSMKK